MHTSYFVVLPVDVIENVDQAKSAATSFLDDNGFSGDGGLYSSPKADWYVVGGRWSGIFTEHTNVYMAYKVKADELLKIKYPELTHGVRGVHYGTPEQDAQHKAALKELDTLWKEAGFTITPLEARDTYLHDGYEDDAVLMTAELLANLRKSDYADAETVLVDECNEQYLENWTDEQLVGRWFVVVDYHM